MSVSDLDDAAWRGLQQRNETPKGQLARPSMSLVNLEAREVAVLLDCFVQRTTCPSDMNPLQPLKPPA